MSIAEKFEDLKNKVLGGQLLDAFEEYYSEDVVMQDNNEEPRRGKEANREHEKQFVGYVDTWNDARVPAVAVNENEGIIFSEWYMDCTFVDGNRMQRTQVSEQKWEDGKIVWERFFYPTA